MWELTVTKVDSRGDDLEFLYPFFSSLYEHWIQCHDYRLGQILSNTADLERDILTLTYKEWFG